MAHSHSSSFTEDRDEEVEVPSDGNDALASETDPLTDPLALDHDYTLNGADKDDTAVESPFPKHRSSLRHPNAIAVDYADIDDVDDEEGDDSGEIVFVDINRLKAAPPLSPHLPPPPAPVVLLPVTPSLDLPSTDPPFAKDDRLRPGVEKPGTDDPDASRSDGSDSGLGSELLNVNPVCDQTQGSELTSPDEAAAAEASAGEEQPPPNNYPLSVPTVTVFRLRIDELPQNQKQNPPSPTECPPRSALKRVSLEDMSSVTESKRARRTVQFDNVTVFYFARIQGFLCVPSVGGCTLGMEYGHMAQKTMTLNEHAAEQRRAHRQQLEQANPNLTRSQQQQQNNQNSLQSSSDESDEEASSASDVDAELTGFLRPVGTKQRRAMLKTAGVRRIEAAEKDECRAIRESREVCGCRCQGYCDPELCYCSINNIKCQVDRPHFPCSCTGECCGNRVGRVEFNPGRVRTHYIHTKMRLELEEKQQRLDDGAAGEQQQRRRQETEEVRKSSLLSRDVIDYNTGRRPFDSASCSSLSQQAVGNLSAFVSVLPSTTTTATTTTISSSSLSAPLPTSPSSVDVGHVDDHHQVDRAEDGSSLMILNRSSFPGDFHGYAGSCYRDEYRAPEVQARAASSGCSTKSNGSTGSQFCNNILQILGIQSTPPTLMATTTTMSPAASVLPARKDYSPRRLIGQVEVDNNNSEYDMSSGYLGNRSSAGYDEATTIRVESSPFVERVVSTSQIDSIKGGDNDSSGLSMNGSGGVIDSSRGSDWDPLRNNQSSTRIVHDNDGEAPPAEGGGCWK